MITKTNIIMKLKRIICIIMAALMAVMSLSARSRKAPVRVTCIGASITEGATTPNPPADSYPGQLGRMLGDKYVVSNFGVGGCTMLKKGDCPYWEKEAYQKALASEPDIVFIDLGGNDSKAINRVYMDEFIKDACEMIASFQNLPTKPRIIIMTPIVSFVVDSNGIYDDIICRQVSPKTIEAASRMKIEVLDMHPVLNRHPELMPDQIHPNREGSEMMARKMYDYLMAYPEKPSPEMTVDGMANNPFITHMYTADPSAHVWKDGRLYVYASHDIFPPRGCDYMDRYHVFSTDDMINWTDHGEILNSGQVPWGRREGGYMWAPDCAYKDGTYYFYFPHPSGTHTGNTWKIGVATSRKPASDFKVQGYIEGVPSYIDPCIFMDDDGQAYIYNGGSSRCYGGKLKDNMVELDGPMVEMQGLNDFHEGAWIHKCNGIYYLSYPDNHINENGKQYNRIHYAMSTSPLGPWDYKGILLEETDCDTSHGSIVEYKGQWYMFYHNCALSGRGNLRSICFDRLFYNEDGTIRIVEQRNRSFLERY